MGKFAFLRKFFFCNYLFPISICNPFLILRLNFCVTALKRATIGAIVACLAGFALAGPMPYSSSAGNAKVQHYSNPMGYSEGYSANSYDVPVSNYKAVTTKPYLTTERPYYSLKKDSYSAGQPYYPTSTPQPAVYYTTASKKNQQHYSSSTPGPMYYSTS